MPVSLLYLTLPLSSVSEVYFRDIDDRGVVVFERAARTIRSQRFDLVPPDNRALDKDCPRGGTRLNKEWVCETTPLIRLSQLAENESCNNFRSDDSSRFSYFKWKGQSHCYHAGPKSGFHLHASGDQRLGVKSDAAPWSALAWQRFGPTFVRFFARS